MKINNHFNDKSGTRQYCKGRTVIAREYLDGQVVSTSGLTTEECVDAIAWYWIRWWTFRATVVTLFIWGVSQCMST